MLLKIVKETLPQAGTPCVETVAVMAKYNPFLKKQDGTHSRKQTKPPPNQCTVGVGSIGFETALLSATNLQNIKS